MVECKICGTIYNEKKAEKLDCSCGCGGDLILCPNCGYALKLNNKTKNKNNFFKKLTDIFRMGY